jgi:uncharacterized membrane protein
MEGIDYQTSAQISSLIGFDISTLTIVSLILNVIVPFIVVWYAMYLLLCKIRIFRNSTINKIIGAFMSFLTIRFGMLAMWLGFAGILAFKFDRWYDKVLSIAVFVILITQISTIFSIHGAFVVVCLVTALLCILKMGSLPMKIVAIVIIFIIYYFLSPYAVTADTQFRY